MRIISLAPSNTEILYGLGVIDQVVAVTRFCDYPEQVKELPNVGGWTDVDIDKIKEQKPDIVFTSGFLQEKIVRKLEEEDIDFVHVDPKNLKDVFSSILRIGRELKIEHKSKYLVEQMKARIYVLAGRVQDKEKKRVYTEEWHKPPSVAGNWVPDLLRLAKAQSMIPSGKKSRETSAEEVDNFDPDLIILHWCGFGEKSNPEVVKKRKKWEEIGAVKEGRIKVLNDALLNRPSPRLVQGLQKLIELIHG